MKLVIKQITAALILILSLSSCGLDYHRNNINGNKKVITEERPVSQSFTKIKSQQGIEVFIRMGTETQIEVEADENLHKFIKTEIKNETLKISCDSDIKRYKAKNVYITLPKISSIEASSGSKTTSENTIISDNLYVKSSSGSNIKLHVNTENLTTNSSSGSMIELVGKTTNLTAKSGSGSAINAYELIALNAKANTNSGSSIKLTATKELNGKANSGSVIKYQGNPNKVVKKESSGGKVKEY